MLILETLRFFAARLHDDERGATAVEYGLLVALIAAVIIGTVLILGGQINAAFQAVTNALTTATAPAGA